MKIQYFADTDTLYINLSNAKIANTEMIADNLIVDFDAEEKVVSITIEQASKTTDMEQPAMQSITLRSHVGSDGILRLQVPVGITDTEVEVVVTIEPVRTPKPKTPEELGWSPGFFEKTFGSWEGEPLARELQGEYEQRDELGCPLEFFEQTSGALADDPLERGEH